MVRPAQSLVPALLILSVLAGCLGGDADDPDIPDVTDNGTDELGFAPRLADSWVFDTFTHEIDTVLQLHGEVFLPDPGSVLDGRSLPQRHPTVLVLSPYLGAGYQGDIPGSSFFSYFVEELTLRGYAVAFISSAATGGTGGCWDFMGPDDQRVAVAAIRAITSQSWSDGKVGMIGVSYDAMTQIMAASLAAEGLVTIIPISPLTHAYAGIYQGGVHYGGLWWATTSIYHQIAATPPGQNQERIPGYIQSVAVTPTCIAQNTVLGNDPTGSYNDYYRQRDFRPMARDVQASVFFMHGFKDANTKPDNPFPWYNDLEVPKKLWLGHWAHSTANATNAGRPDMYPTVHRWFDHWLMGIDNGIDQELGVSVQDSLGRWRNETDWPPSDPDTLVLHPTGDGGLDNQTAGAGAVMFGGPAGAPAATVGQAELDGAVAFTTAPLEQPLHLSGAPRFEVDIESDRAGGQIVALLHLVRPDGDFHLVTRGALNLQHPDGVGPTPEAVVPGERIHATLTFYPTDFVLGEGAVLRLTLRSHDPSEWYTTDPHVATLLAHLGDGTRLELPTVDFDEDRVWDVSCGRLLDDWVPGCHHEEMKDVR